MTAQNSQVIPWNNVKSLQTLISYWDEHRSEFADAKTRETEFANASKAIQEASGEEITTRQIASKMGHMWNRNRSLCFKNDKSGYAAMFEIGSQSLDLVSLGLQKMDNQEAGPKQRGKKNDDFKRQLSPTTSVHCESIEDLTARLTIKEDEITTLKRKLRAMTDESEAMKESLHVQKQRSAGFIQGRGPLDKHVRDRVNDMIALIEHNTRIIVGESSDQVASPNFAEMKNVHPSLYKLCQQVYGFDPEDDLSLLQLVFLGLCEVDHTNLLRAMMGMTVFQDALLSSFPDFFHDRGNVALLYERLIVEQFGQLTQAIFLQSALCSYVKDPRFSDTIVRVRAKHLSNVLTHTLWPLMKRDSYITTSAMGLDTSMKDLWKDQERTQEQIFAQSLMLRAELRLNPDRYEFFWPPPNAHYDKRDMRDDGGGCEQQQKGEPPRVRITLFPGIAAQDPESLARQASSGLGNKEGRRVISKALVLLK